MEGKGSLCSALKLRVRLDFPVVVRISFFLYSVHSLLLHLFIFSFAIIIAAVYLLSSFRVVMSD